MMRRILTGALHEFFHSAEQRANQEVYKETEKVLNQVEELLQEKTMANLRQAHRLLKELGDKYPSTFYLTTNYRGAVDCALWDAEHNQLQPKP